MLRWRAPARSPDEVVAAARILLWHVDKAMNEYAFDRAEHLSVLHQEIANSRTISPEVWDPHGPVSTVPTGPSHYAAIACELASARRGECGCLGSVSSSGTEASIFVTKRLGPPEARPMGDWRCSLRSADQPPDPYHHYDDDDHEGDADVVRHPEDHVVWHVAIAPSLIGSM